MHILSDREIVSALTSLSQDSCRRLLDALSKSLVDYSTGQNASQSLIHQPLRQSFTTAPGHTTLFMPASNTASTGIKVVTLPGNGGAPRGSISIYSPEGELAGLLNAEEVTAFRTGLASMIPFLRCPFPKSRIVVFGAGKQAEWHVRLSLLLTGESIQSITVVNRRASTLKKLQKKLADVQQKYSNVELRFVPQDGTPDYDSVLRSTLYDSDAIMCCTPSTSPLFPSSYLGLGQDIQPKQRFLSLIGSYTPNMQEVDSETIISGMHIYVDSREACLEEAGELIKAKISGDGLIELGEMLSRPELRPLEGNLVYKCVGMGIMDIVIGSELLKVAKEMGIGRTVEDF
ncbi:ornithine cyclodeaminase/mu-crystallin family protein [Xylariales sp. AK1849]|nr:ornithine cyclodeaminase/mu-crystallin family protein [Xylariales sp. AK1849]